jgi:hypothetical protein
MTFVDRANEFINVGGDEFALLRECVTDGGANALAAVQRMAEDMYGGFTYNYELKAPAACALIAFGVPGLRALLEMATRTNTSKNVSLCVGTLSAVAAGAPIARAGSFVRDDFLEAAIRSAATADGIEETARALLREYILRIEDDLDAHAIVGAQLSRLRVSEEPRVATELFGALASRRLTTGPAAMRLYEDLISSHPDDEPTFHSFFERHPQLLDPAAAEVWSKPRTRGIGFAGRRAGVAYSSRRATNPADMASPASVLLPVSLPN